MLSLQRREHRQAWVLLAPMLIAMFILTAWPLARTLWLSFTDTALAGSGEATHYVWLDNYLYALTDPDFRAAFARTLYFTVVSVAIEGAIGVLVALFLILPIVIVIPMSFGTASFPTFPPAEYGVRWYVNFFTDRKWMLALGESMRIGLIVTVVSMVLGATAAMGIHKLRSPRKSWLETLFIVPMSVPAIITAVALYYLCGPLGLINNSVALILGHTVLATPYTFITLRAALKGFDPSLELAAYSLGAKPWQSSAG